MAEFQTESALRKRFRNLGLSGMIAIVLGVFVITGPRAERLGDRFQVVLPIAALGCAVAQGQAVRLVGRYLLLEVFIKGSKFGLGEAEINRRPTGSYQGFPSGHTAVATFGATALVQSCLKDSPAGQTVAIMAAGFTGASRIEAEKHNIWQVLAGAILGFSMQFLALRAFDRTVQRAWRAIRRKKDPTD